MCVTICDTPNRVSTLNLRVDAGTAAFLERVARETGRTKSEIVREALEALRKAETPPKAASPSDTMAHLIGRWDSGGMKLSARTGERFARLLRESKHDHDTGGRRTARRTD
jgi:hypothetical protein